MEDNMSRNQLTPKQQRLLKKRKKKRTKMVLLIIELLIVLIAVVGLALYLMPNSKSYVTKVFMKCHAGQKILRNIYKDDYEENELIEFKIKRPIYIPKEKLQDNDISGISYRLNNHYTNNASKEKKRIWNKVDTYYVECCKNIK